MFTAGDVQARLDIRPFNPVRVVASSGQSYNLTHPELVLVTRRFLVVGVASNENPSHFDSSSRIAILHISDLQDIPRPPSGEKNGVG